MEFGAATYGVGFLAGVLSTLSPCVLPLLPILVASAVSAHRWGALALGVGLALSFTIVGLLLATAGASLGFDPGTVRTGGAALLAAFGLVLLIPRLQLAFARVTAVLSDSGSAVLSRIPGRGMWGQFLIGALLGVVWSPCVGPTLGAATTLASQGRDLTRIALLMLIFGLGASSPLLLLSLLSRTRVAAVRGHLLKAGRYGKQILGLVLLTVGVAIATGLDKSLESWVLDRSPDWLTQLTTRF